MMESKLKNRMLDKITPCKNGSLLKDLNFDPSDDSCQVLILDENDMSCSDCTYIETNYFAKIENKDYECKLNGVFTFERSEETENFEQMEMTFVVSGHGGYVCSETIDNDVLCEILDRISEVKLHFDYEESLTKDFKKAIKKIIGISLIIWHECVVLND